mgnify:CR=1 FL=1
MTLDKLGTRRELVTEFGVAGVRLGVRVECEAVCAYLRKLGHSAIAAALEADAHQLDRERAWWANQIPPSRDVDGSTNTQRQRKGTTP